MTAQYTIYVKYQFVGSPFKDYTLKAYSQFDQPIFDQNHNINEIHMDGQEPSGFTHSDFRGMYSFNCNRDNIN